MFAKRSLIKLNNKNMTKNKLAKDIEKLDAQIAVLEGRKQRKIEKLNLLEKPKEEPVPEIAPEIIPETNPTTSEPIQEETITQ